MKYIINMNDKEWNKKFNSQDGIEVLHKYYEIMNGKTVTLQELNNMIKYFSELEEYNECKKLMFL